MTIFHRFLYNPPMFKENLPKERPLFREFWAKKPTHMGCPYPYPNHFMLPPGFSLSFHVLYSYFLLLSLLLFHEFSGVSLFLTVYTCRNLLRHIRMLLFKSRNCQSLHVNTYLLYLLSKIKYPELSMLCFLFPGLYIE